MDEPMSDRHFRTMTLLFQIRDLLRPRRNVMKEVDIRNGYRILDYGCGPGSHSFEAARLTGEGGRVYALDIHPLALESVRRGALKRRLENIETIRSDCSTGLPDGSIDVVLLYDVYHGLGDPGRILKELNRILKPGGILSLNDHHLRYEEIVSSITGGGLFKLIKKGRRTIAFGKA